MLHFPLDLRWLFKSVPWKQLRFIASLSWQILEYQPAPWDQWVAVGNVWYARMAHAVLSISSQQLPCFSGKSGPSLAIKFYFIKIKTFYFSSMSSPLPHTRTTVRTTCWCPGLLLRWFNRCPFPGKSLGCRLLLWLVWPWQNLCSWFGYWIRNMAANALNTLPSWRLWDQRWVSKRIVSNLLSHQIHIWRCCQLTKLPRQLSL